MRNRMTNVKEGENSVEETTTQPAPAEETNQEVLESEENALQTTDGQEPEESQPDYGAMLREEEERIERARKRRKQLEKEIDEREQSLQTSDPSRFEELQRKIEDLEGQLSGVLTSSRSSVLDKHASNPDERKLIELYLESTIRPSGDFEADVQAAKALINYKKVTRVNAELAKASAIQPSGADVASHRPAPQPVVNLSAADKQLLERRGLLDKYVKENGR